MRFFWRCKQFFKNICIIGLCALLFCLFACVSVEKFPFLEGERTYYLNGKSSQALMKPSLDFSDCFHVQGESVVVRLGNESGEAFAKELIACYDGEILLEERVGELTSYYAYSPKLGEGVVIGGKKVNLHVAFALEKGEAVVGSPIIFGGY